MTLRPVIPGDIIAHVAKVFRVSPEDITGPRHFKHYVAARCIVAISLRSSGLSLPAIGKHLGKDHSTVFHYLSVADSTYREHKVYGPLITALCRWHERNSPRDTDQELALMRAMQGLDNMTLPRRNRQHALSQ